MVVTDGQGIPMGVQVESASIHEVKLLGSTLNTIAIKRPHKPGRPRKKPKRIIADRAYDSNNIRKKLARKGIEPIIPTR